MDLSKSLGLKTSPKLHTLEYYLNNRTNVAEADHIAATKLVVNNYLVMNNIANPSSQSLTIDRLYSENIKQGLNFPIVGMETLNQIRELVDLESSDLEVKPVDFNPNRYIEATIMYLYISRDLYSVARKIISCQDRKYFKDGFGNYLAPVLNNHQTHELTEAASSSGYIEQVTVPADQTPETTVDTNQNISFSWSASNNTWKMFFDKCKRIKLPVKYMDLLDRLFGKVFIDVENSKQPTFLQFWPTACTLVWDYNSDSGEIDFNSQSIYYLAGFGENGQDNNSAFSAVQNYFDLLNGALAVLLKNFPLLTSILSKIGCVEPRSERFYRDKESTNFKDQILELTDADAFIHNISHINYNEAIITHDTIDAQVCFQDTGKKNAFELIVNTSNNQGSTVEDFDALLRGAVKPMDYSAWIISQAENSRVTTEVVQHGPLGLFEVTNTAGSNLQIARISNVNRTNAQFGLLMPNGYAQGTVATNGGFTIKNETVTPGLSDYWLGVGNAYCYKQEAADAAFTMGNSSQDNPEGGTK